MIHEFLYLGNTSGIVSESDEKSSQHLKRAIMKWKSDKAEIDFQCEYVKNSPVRKYMAVDDSFLTVVVRFLDDRKTNNTKFTLVLKTRDYPKAPSMQYISRTGNSNKRIDFCSENYDKALNHLENLKNDEKMDETTSSVLDYTISLMRNNKSKMEECPEFLEKLVKKGYEQLPKNSSKDITAFSK